MEHNRTLRKKHGGGWFSSTFRRVRNPFAGFFSGFGRWFTSKSKPKPNPFMKVYEGTEAKGTKSPSEHRAKNEPVFVPNRHHSVNKNGNFKTPPVMTIEVRPDQIYKPRSRTKSIPKSIPKSRLLSRFLSKSRRLSRVSG
jgi:hypothetical protein